MSQTPQYSIELLAPAKNYSTAIAAIRCGADAVYMGAYSHGARAAASNSVDDIARVCEFAHQFNARVYVTVNTLVYESELRDVEELIKQLYRAGADAIIVQDLGVLRLDIPPIALHASTQCDIRTPEKARFLEQLGFSQLVLPRELTLDEIREMRNAVNVPLESFIHGALCVSYSGACYASLMCGGRSANRGECAQICRLPYDLIDGNGKNLYKGKHLLSLRDLNRLSDLQKLIDAGVSSLKIEGRLKDENYVKNIVSAYDRELHRIGVRRTSDGHVERSFIPDVNRSFNRGFTSHFLFGGNPEKHTLAGFESPKNIGPVIATVAAVKGKKIILNKISEPITNGDGLSFNNIGFRVNKFEAPNIIYTNTEVVGIKPGITLRRNFDKSFTDRLSKSDSTERVIPVELTLRRSNDKVILEDISRTAVAVLLPEIELAKSPQYETHRRVISKLGDTVFRLEKFTDEISDIFIPASLLANLRRKFVDALITSRASTFQRHMRLNEDPQAVCSCEPSNVANSLAEQVYRDHGYSKPITPAWEVAMPAEGEHNVMTTRYCLRRELGACLKTPAGKSLPSELILKSPNLSSPLYLHFDCANCQMNITVKK